MTTSNILSQLGSAGVSTGFKNRIINGAMVISQYNGTSSVTPTANAYVIDRWQAILAVASKYSVQQSSTAPTGYINSLLATSTSAYTVGSTEFFFIRQRIEGLNISDLAWGTANAKTVTLSFWVQSSLTGSFGGSIRNSDASRTYPFSYTISSANTWTQISITIAGDTSGTWLTTNGTGIELDFTLGAGSTYLGTANTWSGSNYLAPTGSVSVVGTNGATLYLTGVQLEVGTTATNFEVRDYGRELILCQRYYAKFGSYTIYAGFGSGFCYSTTAATVYIKYATAMRASPTVSQSSCAFYTAGSFIAITNLASQYTGTDTMMLQASAVGLTVDKPCILVANNNTAAYIDLSAEL